MINISYLSERDAFVDELPTDRLMDLLRRNAVTSYKCLGVSNHQNRPFDQTPVIVSAKTSTGESVVWLGESMSHERIAPPHQKGSVSW